MTTTTQAPARPTRGDTCHVPTCTEPPCPWSKNSPWCSNHRRKGPDWVRATRGERAAAAHTARHAALIEDVEWILTWDRHPVDVVAARVGMRPESMIRVLRRAGRDDLRARMFYDHP